MKYMSRYLFALSFAIFSIGCTGYEAQKKDTGDSLSSLGTNDNGVTGPTTNPNAPLGVLTASVDAKMNLGELQTFNAVYTVDPEYSGNVRFTVDRSSLAEVEGQNDILITVTPGSAVVSPGQQVNLEISINVPFRSPSFEIQQLQLVAYDDNDKTISSNISLDVDSIINVQLKECDYQDNNLLDECWNLPASVDLRAHATAVELHFTNCDPSTDHVVHGNGPIDHQPVGQPMDPAVSADQCVGEYVATIAGDSTATGTYYMHNTQANAQRRTINFGAMNPAVASIASAEDDFNRGPSNSGKTCHDPVGTN